MARATALVERADAAGVPLRIMGGLAVRALCPTFPPRAADDQDLDLASTSSASSAVKDFLTDVGFEPDSRFNAFHGRRQLRFSATDSPLAVDVMLDRLQMCHELDFSDRLERMPHTLDPTDLLLSKLQIIELNAKDLHDLTHLMAGVPVTEDDPPGTIGLERFGEVIRGDWGWWRTVTRNLDHLISTNGEAAPDLPPDPPFDPSEQAHRLREFTDEVPKTRRWRLRAKVGERVRWYELPEEVERR